MEKKKNQKDVKAVSPVISTVLLIMIVIILAIIILLWSRSFIKEAITKEIGSVEKRVNEFCGEVDILPILNNDGTFGFENNGQIPIYWFNVKVVGINSGESEIIKIETSINPGFSIIVEDNRIGNHTEYESIRIIPILLGKTKEGASKTFTCPDINGLVIK